MSESRQTTSIVVVGARGRMGRSLLGEILASERFALAGAVARPGSAGVGEDIGSLIGRTATGVVLRDELDPAPKDVVVDFSLPDATEANLARCVAARAPLVLGTTGLSARTQAQLTRAAGEIPIVAAPNYSVGVTVLTHLAGTAAAALGPDWNAELVEIHHRHKRDAPSGTALRVGQAVADATDRTLETVLKTNRDASGPRSADEIGIMALRGGDTVGEHTLMFFGASERIELTHRALDRAIFSRGALRAARWLQGQAPGLYDMFNVLDLHSL